jgi:hypothetical protein
VGEVEDVHELQQVEEFQQAQCDFLLAREFLLGDLSSWHGTFLALG